MTPAHTCPVCGTALIVGGDDREGTHYYFCPLCNKPSDAAPLQEVTK